MLKEVTGSSIHDDVELRDDELSLLCLTRLPFGAT